MSTVLEEAPTTTPEPTVTSQESTETPPALPATTVDQPVPASSPGSSTTTTEEDLHDDDPVGSLERDHPSFERATVSLILQLLPEDGHPDGRLILAAVKSHNLPPLTTLVRLDSISPLPGSLHSLLNNWQKQLAEALSRRTAERAMQAEKTRREAAERKAAQAARTSVPAKRVQRSKMSKRAKPPVAKTSRGTAQTHSATPPEPQRHLF